MQAACWLLLGIGFLFHWAAAWDPPLAAAPEPAAPWRRTAQGWERALWQAPSDLPPAAPHPLLVAAFQVLASLIGLVAASGDPPFPIAGPKRSAGLPALRQGGRMQ